MSNLNKWYKTEEEQTDLRVISFVSRKITLKLKIFQVVRLHLLA